MVSLKNPASCAGKTAPLPNQTGTSTVTTTNTYDAINRLIKKSYTDSYTPAVQYGYDGVALTGCKTAPPGLTDPYPIDRRTSMCDASGGVSWAHDKMGRIVNARRTIGTAVGNYETDVYNLAGMPLNFTSLNYGVTYVYGAAGKPLSVTNYTGGVATNFVSNATYAAPGELTAMTVGSAGIVANNAYNNRLQPLLLLGDRRTGSQVSLTGDYTH